MKRLEIVGIRVKLDQEAIGQCKHGIDNAKDHLANSVIDEREVSYVSSTSEVEFQDRWVDEGYLSGSDLC